jgi:hypothetical protein
MDGAGCSRLREPKEEIVFFLPETVSLEDISHFLGREVLVMKHERREASSDYWVIWFGLVHEAREGPWAVE